MTIVRATKMINAEIYAPRRYGQTVNWGARFKALGLIERKVAHPDWSGAHKVMMGSKLPYTWTGATFWFQDEQHAAYFDFYLA